MFKKTLSLYLSIVVVGIFIYLGIYFRFKADIQFDRANYISQEKLNSKQAAANIDLNFRDLYQGLRTLARLPGVRVIDRHAKNFDDNANKTFQEIYNNIAVNFNVSEIYIVPVDLDPDLIDPVTQKLEVPIKMYDQLIVGRNAVDNPDKGDKSGLPEVETFEYRLLKKQMAWLRAKYGEEDVIHGLKYPAISGPEVITCDNRLIYPQHPDDADVG